MTLNTQETLEQAGHDMDALVNQVSPEMEILRAPNMEDEIVQVELESIDGNMARIVGYNRSNRSRHVIECIDTGAAYWLEQFAVNRFIPADEPV